MVAIIVAMSENRVIGRDNGLPWHLPADLKHFKVITTGHPIIMGRKTFESLGKPLPRRTNIIVTRQEDYAVEGAVVVHAIAEGLEKAKEQQDEQVFVIGGAEIFKQAMPQVDTLFLTWVHAEVEGDVFFPELEPDEWQEVERERHEADEKHAYAFSFVKMVRRG
jgi:dihydrofolate reductase